MKRNMIWTALLAGLMSSLVVMAISYLGNVLWQFPFLPFELFDWMTRNLPGAVIETVIQSMVAIIHAFNLGPTDTTAKLAEQIQAMGMVLVTGVLFALVLAWVAVKKRSALNRAGLSAGLLLWLGLVLVEFTLPGGAERIWLDLVWFFLLVSCWSLLLIRIMGAAADEFNVVVEREASQGVSAGMPHVTRRNLLVLSFSGVVSFLILLLGLDRFRRLNENTSTVTQGGAADTKASSVAAGTGEITTSGPAASPPDDVLSRRISPVPGTRQELSPDGQFYRIDINSLPAEIDEQDWHLSLDGLVENDLALTLPELKNYPAVTQAVTMSCISNPVAGDLIGTAFWTGLRLRDLLLEAGVLPEVVEIAITSADGFFESVPLDEAMDERTLLVYAMNGSPLPARHGFPLRIYIPNHYGMKQPKWIKNLKAVDSIEKGYWVQRGWSRTAYPQVTSVIDSLKSGVPEINDNGELPLGGIAWAGDRGIDRVELQIDGGEWREAELRSPALSPLTWVQWRYDGWKPDAGEHTVKVRAIDGSGEEQVAKPSSPSPDGATGLHSVTFTL